MDGTGCAGALGWVNGTRRVTEGSEDNEGKELTMRLAGQSDKVKRRSRAGSSKQ